MAKTLQKWLDEFVNNGADASNVTDWPENVSGGGSMIVDALPAEGKEGATYLLRKEQTGPTSFKLYEGIYGDFTGAIFCISKNNEAQSVIKSFEAKWFSEFNKALPDPSVDSCISSYMPEEFFEEKVAQGNIVLVESLEDLPAKGPGKEIGGLHYLGEFTNNDFKMIECNGGNDEQAYQILDSFIEMSGLVRQISIENNTFVRKNRDVYYDTEATQWVVGQWYENDSVTIVTTLTDEIITDNEQFYNLLDLGQGALITFTPVVITYSYTQYVFDKGAYTVVGGSTGGIYTIQVKGSTDSRYPENYSFTIQVDSRDIETYGDLLIYLINKGYYFNWSSGEGNGFVLQAVGKISGYGVTGVYTFSGSDISIISTSVDSYSLDSENIEITYLGE